MKRLVALLLASSALPASAYICTDDNGKVTFQGVPCEVKRGNSANKPYTASQLTEELTKKTIQRFYDNLELRDLVSAERMLGPDFVGYEERNGQQTVRVQRQQFWAVMSLSANAAKRFKVKVQCKKIELINEKSAHAECDVTGDIAVLSREKISNAHINYRVAIYNNEVKLKELRIIK